MINPEDNQKIEKAINNIIDALELIKSAESEIQPIIKDNIFDMFGTTKMSLLINTKVYLQSSEKKLTRFIEILNKDKEKK